MTAPHRVNKLKVVFLSVGPAQKFNETVGDYFYLLKAADSLHVIFYNSVIIGVIAVFVTKSITDKRSMIKYPMQK